MADLTTEDIRDRMAYARDLHESAVSAMGDWEKLYKAEYTVPKKIGDIEDATDTATVFKPSKPRAILQKILALLSLRAQMKNQVVPLKDTNEEQRICSRLEQYLEGYQYRVQTEAARPIYRHAVQWALLRGKLVLQVQYLPSLVNSEYFPIRTVAPDPKTVYEVPSTVGMMYVVTEEMRYVWDLKRELSKKGGTGGWSEPAWIRDGKDLRDTDQVALKTYWDVETTSVLVDNDEVLAPTPHEYGFLPFAIGYIEDSPFLEPQWRGQSVLAPIMDALKSEAALLSTLADAAELFFFPIGIWQSPDGRCGWLSSNVAALTTIPVDAKVTFYNPAPNIPILQSYKAWLSEEIQLYSLPNMAFALDVAVGAQSGFAIAQVLGQVMDKIEDKKQNLEFATGMHFGQVLRLTEKFASRAEGGRFEVMSLPTGDLKPSRRRALVGVSADDVKGHHQVLTHISPVLPTERMSLLQQANLMRQRDPVSKMPLADDDTIREYFPEIFEHPEKVGERVKEEFYRTKVPEIDQWETEEFMQEWQKDHKPHMSAAVKGDLSKLSKDDLINLVRMAQMMIQHPEVLQQALQQSGQPGQPPPGGMPGQPPPGALGQPILPSNMLPPAMQTGQPQPFNPQDVALQQEQNALMPPGLGG